MNAAAKSVSYEILSRDTVRQMHRNFMAGVEKKAKAALPEGTEVLLEDLKKLLISGIRKNIEIKDHDLAKIATEGKEVIAKRTIELEDTAHSDSPFNDTPSTDFSAWQKDKLASAKKKRRDNPEVLKLFGEEERIYLRMKNNGNISQVQNLISAELAKSGYRITDYNNGYATNEKGKQQFKIGKLLKENQEFYNAFREDSTRTLGNLMAVISRNADDIAYMSTGRGWFSCMGSNSSAHHYLPKDIKKGTLIAYMISEKDPDINNPLGRIVLKPFQHRPGAAATLSAMANWLFGWGHPQEHVENIFLPGKPYGINNESFTDVVKQFVEEKLNRGKEGEFQLVEGLYQDNLPTLVKRKNEVTTHLEW